MPGGDPRFNPMESSENIFREIYQKYARMIYNCARAYSRDTSDIMQETFLRFFKRFHPIPSDMIDAAYTRSWLLKTARYVSLESMRKAGRETPISILKRDDQEHSETSDFEDSIRRDEKNIKQIMTLAISRIYREDLEKSVLAFYLRYPYELSLINITKIIGSDARSLIFRNETAQKLFVEAINYLDSHPEEVQEQDEPGSNGQPIHNDLEKFRLAITQTRKSLGFMAGIFGGVFYVKVATPAESDDYQLIWNLRSYHPEKI